MARPEFLPARLQNALYDEDLDDVLKSVSDLVMMMMGIVM